MLAAGAVAGVCLLVIALATGSQRAASVAATLGVAAGVTLGWWWIEARPHWPTRTAADRLLVFVLPAATLIEVLACLTPRWLGHGLRLLGALAVAPVLLDGSKYVLDWAGPGTREWPTDVTILRCAGLGSALAVAWLGMTWLAQRSPRRGHLLALTLCCALAGPIVAFSGYKSGGEMAFPLTAALLGAAIASLVMIAGAGTLTSAIGLGVVAYYGLLFLGVFFASLEPVHAALMLVAPLACWLPEIPLLYRLGPWWRSAMRVVFVTLPMAIVLWRVT